LFACTINVNIKSTSAPLQHTMIVYGMDIGDVARKVSCFSIPPSVSVGGMIGVPDDRVVGVGALVDGVTDIVDMRVRTLGVAAL